MTGRIPEHGEGPGEQCPPPLSLAGFRFGTGKRAVVAERPVHQGDANEVVSQATECANPYFDRLHRDEHSLFVLTEQELPTGPTLDCRMEALSELVKRANVIKALRARLLTCPGDEEGVTG